MAYIQRNSDGSLMINPTKIPKADAHISTITGVQNFKTNPPYDEVPTSKDYFEPFHVHRALYNFAKIGLYAEVEPQVPSLTFGQNNDLEFLFSIIAALVDPSTRPSVTGDDNRYALSIDFISNIAIVLYYSRYATLGKTMSQVLFDMCFSLAKIVERTSIKLNAYDQTKLPTYDGLEGDNTAVNAKLLQELDNWAPNVEFFTSDRPSFKWHDMKVYYAMLAVSIYTIGNIYKNYLKVDNLSLNPFLMFFLKYWKIHTQVLALALEFDRNCECLEIPFASERYPEVIRQAMKGASMVRTVLAIILNDGFDDCVHDLKHECFNNFRSPWGRKQSNGALSCDMRLYVSSLLALDSDMLEVTSLLVNMEPDDKFDEDIYYVFDYELDDIEEEIDVENEVIQRQIKNQAAFEDEERDEDGDGSESNTDIDDESDDDEDIDDEEGISDSRLNDLRGFNNVVRSFAMKFSETDGFSDEVIKCDCKLDDPAGRYPDMDSTYGSANGSVYEDAEAGTDADGHKVQYKFFKNDGTELAYYENEGKFYDVKTHKEIDKEEMAVDYNPILNRSIQPKAVRSQAADDKIDEDGVDWRDIPRGDNIHMSASYNEFPKKKLITDMNGIISLFEAMAAVDVEISSEDANRLIISIATAVVNDSSLSVNGKQGTEPDITPDKIYNAISKDYYFEKMIVAKPWLSFEVINELMMCSGYRRVLIWFLTHLELSLPLIEYVQALLLGKACIRSREGGLTLSEVEKSMLLHEFFANAAVYLSRGTNDVSSNSDDEKDSNSEYTSVIPADNMRGIASREKASQLIRIMTKMVMSLYANGILQKGDREYSAELQALFLQWVVVSAEVKQMFDMF